MIYTPADALYLVALLRQLHLACISEPNLNLWPAGKGGDGDEDVERPGDKSQAACA